MITSWLFEFFHELREPAAQADPAVVQAHFRWYMDLWTRAEARGYDGIFFSEHHFGAGYSPSPNLIISNLAPRTSTMRLGVLGTVTPYATPWRVMEEFAMLDHLTAGRLEMGVVSGIPPEFMTAGLSIPEMAERHAEICDVIDAARRGGPVSHAGKHWNFTDLRLLPPMLRTDAPMWTAVRGPESAVKAAGRGWKVCSGFNSVANIAATFDAYRNAADDAGFASGPDQLGVRRMVTFVDDPADQQSGIQTAKRALLDVLNSSAGPLPPFAAVLDRPGESSEMLSDDEFVSGTPAQVAEQLIEQCRAVGAAHSMIMFSDIEPAALERSHELFAAEVIPALHSAGL